MRSDRLCPPACLRLFPTPTPGLRVSGASSAPTFTTFSSPRLARGKLSPHFHSVLYPDTYGNASGVGRTTLQCVPQPPLAIPTRKDSHLIYVLHSEQLAIRHQPPTHKRTDERTVFRLWHIVYRPFGQRGYIASGASAYFPHSIPPQSTPLQSNPRSHKWRSQFGG